MKYKKAPVSEVILGATFKVAKLELAHVFGAQALLRDTYPQMEVRPPLANEVLSEYRLNTEINPENTGPFLLRMRSGDLRWLVQIQRNKLYLNWVRPDTEKVGNYVGFETVFGAFQSLCDVVGKVSENFAVAEVQYFEVTYHDRLEWQSYVENLSDLPEIMNFQPPQIGAPQGFNNVFSKYTFQEPDVGGYGVLSVSTDTSPKSVQILKFETSLRGRLDDVSYDKWMHRANEKQVEFFENMFVQETLDRWK